MVEMAGASATFLDDEYKEHTLEIVELTEGDWVRNEFWATCHTNPQIPTYKIPLSEKAANCYLQFELIQGCS